MIRKLPKQAIVKMFYFSRVACYMRVSGEHSGLIIRGAVEILRSPGSGAYPAASTATWIRGEQ